MLIRTLVLGAALVAFGCAPAAETVEPSAEPGEPIPVLAPLPEGDALAGRQAFLDLRCNACHYVDETMEPPISTTPGPDMGPHLSSRTGGDLATSIIMPSHFNAERRQEFLDGAISRMGDYSKVMTVQQWTDLVAFLHAL